ncbi:MAG: hypothetical protein ACXVII_10190 [Solirubrobacteraceae bacterium]
MQITKAFVKATNARLIVGINLEANSRRLASVEAHALVSGLGASSIRALQIGNEPELYGTFGWYRTPSGHRCARSTPPRRCCSPSRTVPS